MTPAERELLRRYHEALGRRLYVEDTIAAGRAFRAREGIRAGHALIPILQKIAEAHGRRCVGESSPADCDALFAEVTK